MLLSFGTRKNENNVKEPIWTWSPSIAPAGIEVYQNSAIPEWDNSLLLAVLKNKQLIQLKLNEAGTAITAQHIYLTNTYGRLRDVLVIPDGRVFLCTSNRDYAGSPIAVDDRIIELRNPEALNSLNHNEDKISIHPVPSDNILKIESDLRIATVLIVNTEGKEVFAAPYFSSVDVSALSSGVYFLQLLGSDKKVVARRKIVIK